MTPEKTHIKASHYWPFVRGMGDGSPGSHYTTTGQSIVTIATRCFSRQVPIEKKCVIFLFEFFHLYWHHEAEWRTMAKSPRKHTLCTPLSIDQLFIFGIFEHEWGTRKHIDDLKKYSWCIPVQKKIKPIIWGAAIMPEPWNRQQC